MVEFIKRKDGSLRIKWVGNGDRNAKSEIREKLAKYGSDTVFSDITESYWTNSWGVHLASGQLGQMSDCLVIAEDSSVEDNGSITLTGKTWTNIHNYMVICPVTEILEKGYVDFGLWENFENGENFPNPYIVNRH